MPDENEVQEGNESQVAEGQESQESQASDIEQRARDMGHVPLEDFRGDPDKWVDATEFVRRGETQMPILRERLGKTQDDLKKIRGELQQSNATMKEFAKYHEGVEQRAYDKARDKIKAERADAVAAGDSAAFTAADNELETLDANKPKPVVVTETSPDQAPVFLSWKEDNAWYDEDPELHAAAEAFAELMHHSSPNIKGKEFFEAVTAKVKATYPQKFENSRRKDSASVEGAGGGSKRSNGKAYGDLPAEAKAACDKFVKQGLMTQKAYLSEYDWS